MDAQSKLISQMLKLPNRFKRKLDQCGDHLQVELSIIKKNFSQIYIENNTYFFNEYTDHGVRHINSVLSAIDNLMPDDSWKVLSEKDVFIILMSTFLHDLGMHLQPLTFKALVDGEYDDIVNYGFNDAKWASLWEEYLGEARKWNEEELNNIFGDPQFEIDIPDFNKVDRLNENQKKLIGEFIRRHHPRIAFEIAFKGLKSHDGVFIDLCPNLSEELRFISGIVARSHGMHVRETFVMLKKKFLDIWKKPNEVNIIYLMLLLRLGDYLQVDGSRIFKVPYKTKLFKSPISIFEHEKHFSLIGYQPLDEDSETLYFNAKPTNSVLYVAIKDLLNAIQNEFDTSWAILGEIYGPLKSKQKLAIKYRRIKSNLDDVSYTSMLPFIPKLISFSADKELLKLLIAPLYGYNPSYGIRELVQNSVDACHERKLMVSNTDSTYKGEIVIRFDMDQGSRTIFSITDNGKGMTIAEIQNYFLRAGASLKKSKEWRKVFVKDNKTPAIHRIGKFGIGVLAAYLLGNKIEVKTRHHGSEVGYVFSTSIDDANIEVTKSVDLNVGTQITIFVADDVRNKLLKAIKDRLLGKDWDKPYDVSSRWDKWYTLKEPVIKISVYNFPVFTPYVNPDPSYYDRLPPEWREFSNAEFQKIQWTYHEGFSQSYLSCNGIVIPQAYEFKKQNISNLSFKKPYISVYDFNGNLNLDLNRNSLLNRRLQFEDDLFNEIYKDLIRQVINLEYTVENNCLVIGPETILTFGYAGLNTTYDIIFSDAGYVVNLPFLNQKIVNKDILDIRLDMNEGAALINQDFPFGKLNIMLSSQLINLKFAQQAAISIIEEVNPFLPTETQSPKIKEYIRKHVIDPNIGKRFGVKSSIRNISRTSLAGNVEKRFDTFCKHLFGDGLVIPFDREKRKLKFQKAFRELNIDIS